MTSTQQLAWEKLILDFKLLRPEDFGALIPLCVSVDAYLRPKENLEACSRNLQFMAFEILKCCETLSEGERWESLRTFVFESKGFQLCASPLHTVDPREISMKSVLEDRRGHPLALVFLLLHLAHILDIPVALVQARHHFLLKWVRSGKTLYLDVYNEGRALTGEQLIQVLNRNTAKLEVWNARQLITKYLELLGSCFEQQQDLNQLHTIYNLILILDENNTQVIGQRAVLRHRLGFGREALSDLKRYFSFVDQSHAPPELQQIWWELERIPEPPQRSPTELLH